MKKYIIILTAGLLFSCEKQPKPIYLIDEPTTNEINHSVIDTNYVFGYVDPEKEKNFIEEFKYKGHVYLCTRSYQNYVSLTHAGHCAFDILSQLKAREILTFKPKPLINQSYI